MNRMDVLTCSGLLLSFVACGSSPPKRKDRAEAELTQEKNKTMQEYKTRVKKAKDDRKKLETCERLLKAIHTW